MLTIGSISKLLDIPISTIRYYDKIGLLPNIDRNEAGIRQFSDADIEALNIIECLKSSGMQLKDIKIYMEWCKEGDATLPLRRELFYEQKDVITSQIMELQKVLDILTYKCWYYDKAVEDNTESIVRTIDPSNMPRNIEDAYYKLHMNKNHEA